MQALFLYPLNALIASQRDRLQAWTQGLGGKVKFCLYNGMTPQRREKAHVAKENPSEILDRPTLRETPPPLLVTNATMLEYMLVRREDAPILEQSKGMLKWIILDEAHTYIGSQAAELSLLLRRVMHGFGVSPKQVRFVATSATIGEGASKELGSFLADLAGIDQNQVHVIGGSRQVPELTGKANGKGAGYDELAAIEAEEKRFESLVAHPVARKLRDFVTTRNAVSLSQIGKKIGEDPLPWLDLCSGTGRTTPKGAKESFLPLRSHIFHRVTPGIWVCPDKGCKEKHKTRLDDEKWPFGMVYLEQRDKCRCGAPLFDLVSCSDCGAQMLLAEEDKDWRLVQKIWRQEDEFSLIDEDDEENDVSQDESSNGTVLITNKRLEVGQQDPQVEKILFDPETQETGENIESPIHLMGVKLDHGEVKCPCCGKEEKDGRQLFRRRMLGAPFHLGTVIPATLEYCPEGKKAGESPHYGKRLITFTDSRQGTARIAVRQQQDAERNAVRSIVYHALRKQGGASSEELSELEEDIAELQPLAKKNKRFAKMLKEKQQEREAKSGYQPMSWDEMCGRLAEAVDVKKWIHRYYQDMDRNSFGKERVRELAGMLLAREFSRRPMRQNSLETMGLVSVYYPALKNCKTVPEVWKARGASLAEWRDFLKICLDFHVRGNTLIDLPDNWVRWMGAHFYAKRLLAPSSKDRATPRLKLWPQFKRRGLRTRLIRLLFHVLHLDSEQRDDRDICDDLLQKAWTELLNRGLLQQSNYEYYLPLKQFSFRLMQKAWVCPVTDRFLDVTLKGTTPYLLQKITPQNSQCGTPLDIPILETEQVDERKQALAAAQQWLEENTVVKALRQRGLWSDVSDRIIENARVFRVAEHSAQQPGWRLKRYEKLFKQEKINILSCSTTMEMGVDIGGIATVAMNNVPPHPSNYLQRAGRAGRRGEARATAVTICKDNAHEQMVFNNSRWAFETPPPVPHVSLNSAPIVQRHVNSLLLSHFFNHQSGLERLRLKAGNFFLPDEDAPCSRAEQFLDLCVRLESDMPKELQTGLANLLRGTIKEGSEARALLAETREQLTAFKDKWEGERKVLADQLAMLTSSLGEKDPAVRSVSIQLHRMQGEYLLSELATAAFLPGYGFPLHVTSLNTITREQLEREKEEPERDDNRLMARNLPARDAATAIREYAPGANIVLDGKVYQSCGLSLTWQTPMNESEIREAQDIRTAWRCRNCGTTGVMRSGNREEFCCPSCNEAGQKIEFKTFIQPSGYTVDFFEEPHNDINVQTYLPVKAPWIAIDEPWQSLSDPSLGRCRTSRAGRIFIHSSGKDNCGYSLCLGCGRAASQSADGELAEIFEKPHNSPRFNKKGEECKGNANEWLIKRDLHLGFEYQTDVFELQLKQTDGTPLHDKTIALSLAVALRRVLAARLGIDTREIGYLVVERRENGHVAHSLILHDTNSGGSGYACQAQGIVDELFREVMKILDCPEKCEKSCHRCLLSHDTRFDIDHLDRKKSLQFLQDTKLIDRLHLPKEFCFFGDNSKMESERLVPEALQRSLHEISADQISFFVAGDAALAELQAAPFMKYIHRWAADGKHVALVFDCSFFDALEEEQRLGLISLLGVPRLEIHKSEYIKDMILEHEGHLLCKVARHQGEQWQIMRWASADPLACLPGPDWGTAENSPIVRSTLLEKAVKSQTSLITREELLPANSGDRLIEIRDQLDGDLSSFGQKFWDLLEQKLDLSLQDSSNVVKKMMYSDRYICSPLQAALLFQLVNELRERTGVNRVEINTAKLDERGQRQPYALHHNWQRTQKMKFVLRLLVMKSGAQPVINTADKRDLPHARSLRLEYENGKRLTLFLDQGLGYWRSARDMGDFPFEADEKQQADYIQNLAGRISGDTAHATYVVVRKEEKD